MVPPLTTNVLISDAVTSGYDLVIVGFSLYASHIATSNPTSTIYGGLLNTVGAPYFLQWACNTGRE
ncbi:hypothetical protein AKO1_002861, partial [Acrasis kona]